MVQTVVVHLNKIPLVCCFKFIKVWDDEEDEYLARAVFENMHLNDEKVAQFTKGKVLVTRRICIFKVTRLSLNCVSTVSLIYVT
ncbi:hypothetical protein Hdeb2414_s0016g00476901 [Helianthus debilis subsp. tardiflorus]